MNPNVSQVKRYQIAKVYRRDQPAVARGRMREFHQCDFDIAGAGFDPMLPDAEIIKIVVSVFDALGLDVTIKINHRKILDGIFTAAGVPHDKLRTISAAVDKADKLPWSEVEKEMVAKGLPLDIASSVGNLIQHSGSIDSILEFLSSQPALETNEFVTAGLKDMRLLASYLTALGIPRDKIQFDLTLARGLDYYTGLIYEVLYKPAGLETNQANSSSSNHSLVGSIAGGGRYDNLVGMYSRRATPYPCVGVSFGIERIYTLLQAKASSGRKTSRVDVFVMAFGGKEFNGLLLERLAITSQLWDAGIRAEFTAKVKPKLPQQFKAAADIPIAVILGQEELEKGEVKVKILGLPDGHPDKDGVLIRKENLVAEVKKRLEELSM